MIEVEPEILRVIKSASVPIAVPPNVEPPATLPGSVGTVAGLRLVLDLMRRGIDSALDYRAAHGDIYRFSISGNPMVGIWDADTVLRAFKNEEKAWSTAMGWGKYMFEGLDPERGNIGGLLAIDFDEHKVARKLVGPAFTSKAMDDYLGIAQRHFAEAHASWVKRGRVSFKKEARSLLSDVANEIFTGVTDPGKKALIDKALVDFWYVQFAIVKNAWLSPTFRRGRRGAQILFTIFRDLVDERRGKDGKDLFSRMCGVTERDGLADEDVVRVFVNVLGAAFDTTSAGLTSMAYLLAKHPDWQERLREEARATDNPRELKQTELVWKETLRLMPVATFVPRRTLRAVDVLGHRLPAGTLALVGAGAMGRHPSWWNGPTKFDPERFLPSRAEDKKHPAIYNPFGAGAHACIGMHLATLEVKAYFHDLLRRCRFELTDDYEARHAAAPLGTVSGDVGLTLTAL